MKSVKLINFIDMSLDEIKMVLNWRNSENIRKWMYTQDEISLQKHLNFIENLKMAKDKLYFLVKKNGENMGVINFTNLNNDDIYFGLYANPTTKLLGVGRILEEISIDFAFNELKVKKLKLEVFEDNVQVRNLHKKYKFKENGEKFINNKKVICMELENENMHSCGYL